MRVNNHLIAPGIACILACVGSLPTVAQNDGITGYGDIVLGDKPAAYWRFDDASAITSSTGVRKPGELDGRAFGGAKLGQAGPRAPLFADFAKDNAAAQFDGKGGRIVIADPGADSALDFNKGDSITIEAWIRLESIGDGQQVYIIGKGRTDPKSATPHNQNWALRLRGADGKAGVSFLFRSIERSGERLVDPDAYWHRWTSAPLIVPVNAKHPAAAAGWHHVAVTYTFGKGDSVRGYIDGKPVKGEWDIGGQTDAAPVTDDGEVWIGSSMGGNPGNSFTGAIDEVAIHRAALSAERMAARFERSAEGGRLAEQLAKNPAAKPAQANVGPAPVLGLEELKPAIDDVVQVHIYEGLPDKHAWPEKLDKPVESFELHDFVLPGIPQKYSSRGVRMDRGNPAMVRLIGKATVQAGEYRFVIRSLNGARLIVDGKEVAANRFLNPNASGHERVPLDVAPLDKSFPPLPTGHTEKMVTVKLAAGEHTFVYDLLVGGRKLRTETGEPFVAIGKGDEWMTLSPGRFRMSETKGWGTYTKGSESWLRWPGGMRFNDPTAATARWDRLASLRELEESTRHKAGALEDAYWKQRHLLAREVLKDKAPQVPAPTPDYPATNAVDHFLNATMAAAKVKPASLTTDGAFARRLWLDVTGAQPSVEELSLVRGIVIEHGADWRKRLIDEALKDWADQWVGYWQDVLAENPNLVKPMLNNTGPFRWWIHESFADGKAMDRFATELIRMEGSELDGGPAGFAMASQNDVPMAAKAHVIAKAFLGVEMKCARCHDAPHHPFTQKDLFSIAAMLERKPIAVPKTSSVPGTPEHLRRMSITVSLKPGEQVAPAWSLEALATAKLPDGVIAEETAKDSRQRLAAIITSPNNMRFAQVIVNRLWKRYMGYGLVDPVDDWENAKPSHPQLLDWLAHELATHDYDLKHVARLILNSHAYQRTVGVTPTQTPKPEQRLFASQVRRRLSAEQVVDSLFNAAGKSFNAEMLTFDQDGRRPPTEMLNLHRPTRAWQLVSMSNERDRPALALPMAQVITDTLQAFGWRDNRPDPITEREDAPNVLQPLVLANSPIVNRIARLSDDSDLVWRLEKFSTPEEAASHLFARFLTRAPGPDELKPLAEHLRPGFASRVVDGASSDRVAAIEIAARAYRTPVSWSNHLSAEATTIKLELEKKARAGDEPTKRFTADWRQRVEDVIWALMNSPEFLFVP